MRTLSTDIIIRVSLLLVFMLGLCALHIHVSVRYRRDAVLVPLTFGALFGIPGVFCLMMESAIVNLNIEHTYARWAHILLSLAAVAYAASFLIYAALRNKEHPLRVPLKDLKAVFRSIDDLALIADYKGLIFEVNHPKTLSLLGPGIDTLGALWDLFREKAAGFATRYGETPPEQEEIRFEFELDTNGTWYCVNIIPIISRSAFLGHTVLLQDITDIKKTEKLLAEQNTKLYEANSRLLHEVQIAGVLEAERERLCLLERIQAELIIKIEQTIANLNTISSTEYKSRTSFQNDVSRIAAQLRMIYKDVRKSINSITGKER